MRIKKFTFLCRNVIIPHSEKEKSFEYLWEKYENPYKSLYIMTNHNPSKGYKILKT